MFFLISYATAIRGVELALVMRLGRYVHASHLPAPEISVRRSMIQEEAEHPAALEQTRMLWFAAYDVLAYVDF